MKIADIDLSKLLDFRPDLGKLLLDGDRMLIFRQAALASLRRLVFEHLGPAVARAAFAQFGERCGAGDFTALTRNYAWDSEHDAIASGPVMHMWEGLVHVEVTRLEFDRGSGHFAMAGVWRNSYEAEIHLSELGRSPTPVCHSLTGYATGWASAFFGRPLLAVETCCVAQGAPHCAFEIKPTAAWGPEADPWRLALDPAQLAVVAAQERLIEQQRRELRAMTAPIVQIWDDVLLVTLIGTLDAERAAAITGELLPRAAATRARFVIFDLTTIDALDAIIAGHLLRMLQALRLLGADAVVTGIAPGVAQALVAAGTDLRAVEIRATLRDGLHHCMTALRSDR